MIFTTKPIINKRNNQINISIPRGLDKRLKGQDPILIGIDNIHLFFKKGKARP